MKTCWVALRVVKFNCGVVVTYPIGVFTDEQDARRASEEAPQALAGANQQIRQVMGLVGIAEVGGGLMKLPYVAGSGLVTDVSGVILPPKH